MYTADHQEERGTQTEMGWVYSGRSWCQLPYRAVSGWASEEKDDGCTLLRTGRSELHDIASRDIAPSDESVLKPRLTPKSGSHCVVTVLCSDLLCSLRGPCTHEL